MSLSPVYFILLLLLLFMFIPVCRRIAIGIVLMSFGILILLLPHVDNENLKLGLAIIEFIAGLLVLIKPKMVLITGIIQLLFFLFSGLIAYAFIGGDLGWGINLYWFGIPFLISGIASMIMYKTQNTTKTENINNSTN